ncbi:MAG: DNA (cytosine-5-)-methyltransferase [Crenarchaeota archaeon]|nr:DNA (cytosine-5-)-methyltransferase [Thermoproteota archaeon]
MFLDDKDYNFKGCYDNYWLCKKCGASAFEKVRYGKRFIVEWQKGENDYDCKTKYHKPLIAEQTSLFDKGEELEHLAPIKSSEWNWSFADYPKEKNGLKVFSCFACGGGSTMGYKLAGCDVIGDLEIDPKMNDIYVKNHKPKHNYLMDIREFNKLDNLPKELYNIDILDGSPPCTPFSMAGEREDSWGKKKKFREGQAEQTLDDLSFIFIETINKLRPKVAIMENVEGLIKGAAWEYVRKIYAKFTAIGYNVKHWLLKGENMGVPQRRHRVFFIATRLDFDLEKIDMNFNYAPINYGEIKAGKTRVFGGKFFEIAKNSNNNDKSIADTRVRMGQKGSAFQCCYIRNDEVLMTIRSNPDIIDIEEIKYLSWESYRNAQTFPQDYNFFPNKVNNVGYICGMSVPPLMIKRVVTRLIESGIFKQKGENDYSQDKNEKNNEI